MTLNLLQERELPNTLAKVFSRLKRGNEEFFTNGEWKSLLKLHDPRIGWSTSDDGTINFRIWFLGESDLNVRVHPDSGKLNFDERKVFKRIEDQVKVFTFFRRESYDVTVENPEELLEELKGAFTEYGFGLGKTTRNLSSLPTRVKKVARNLIVTLFKTVLTKYVLSGGKRMVEDYNFIFGELLRNKCDSNLPSLRNDYKRFVIGLDNNFGEGELPLELLDRELLYFYLVKRICDLRQMGQTYKTIIGHIRQTGSVYDYHFSKVATTCRVIAKRFNIDKDTFIRLVNIVDDKFLESSSRPPLDKMTDSAIRILGDRTVSFSQDLQKSISFDEIILATIG